jgi:hypothetical protein
MLTRARVAIFLSVLVLFFGVAIFSPLHKHTPGKANSCSFNHIENQMVSLAEAAVVIAPLVFLLEAAAEAEVASALYASFLQARDRAPPVLS